MDCTGLWGHRYKPMAGGWEWFLTLKSEVWVRNTDFGVISVDVVDEFPGERSGGLRPIL